MTDKTWPLGESLKPNTQSESSDSNGTNDSSSVKPSRKKSSGKLGNNKSTGSAKKPRKAAASKKATAKKPAVAKKASNKKTAPKVTAKKATAKKPAVAKKASNKKTAPKVTAKKATAKKRQSTRTKNPPTAESVSKDDTKQVIESDPDKTSVVDVKEKLGQSRPSLLDRLLDTSSVGNEETSPDEDPNTIATNGQIDEGLPLDSEKSDDLFSNLNRAPESKKSKSSDDFEDLLLDGLSSSETSKVVQSKSKAQHWTKQDPERPTDIPSSKAGRAKKSINRVDASSSAKKAKTAIEVDEDATDKIQGDRNTPIGRQTSRPKPTPPLDEELKPLADESKDSSESTTIHDTPNSEIVVETSKPEVVEASGLNSSEVPSVSAGVSAVRNRARKKAEAAKKRLTQISAVDDDNQSTAEMSKENTTSTVQDKDEQTKVSNGSKVSSRKTEEEIEEPESEDGFESSNLSHDPESDGVTDVTGEIDRRGRGFKVSTELVKQSLRPPQRVRARKVRRVVRHVDPWSVLTFSVLFHLTIFSSLLLGSVLIWQVAAASGTIENIEDVVKDLGSFETYELNGWAIFRAAVAVAAIFTLASTILVVIMSVIFNLISDLVGGIRVTVVQEETVRVQRDK